MKTSESYSINLSEIVAAIETSASLVGVDDTHHGKRVGCIAYQIGYEMGYSLEDLKFLFQIGMLHDIGVSSDSVYRNLKFNFDWEQSHTHCEIGYKLLNTFTPLAECAIPILYHHTHWCDLKQMPISPKEATMANIIYLSDRIDALASEHYESDILLVNQDIIKTIKQKQALYFAPDLVKTFLNIAQSEAFWIILQERHVTQFAWDMISESPQYEKLSFEQVKQFASILAYMVDQKSPYTAQHSFRIAELAKYLATTYGMSEEQSQKIELAALLHDLGMLRIPDDILKKSSPLTLAERSIIRQHSYETYEILRHIHGFEEIAIWAAFHHEGLNGHGYPFHRSSCRLPMEARIIAISDIFQSFIQDSPYRQHMEVDHIIEILSDMATIGKLDRSLVELLKQHQQHCVNIALGKLQTTPEDAHPHAVAQPNEANLLKSKEDYI